MFFSLWYNDGVGNIVTQSWFNRNWQELESINEPHEPGVSTPGQSGELTTYLWGLRYVDDLVLRERDGERLYSLQDANWNVVALCNENGEVVSRLKYSAFGEVEGLHSDWNRTFTGQVYDNETGLMLYRNRYFCTELGRFITRDPILYEAGDANVYRYVNNRTINDVDPMGLDKKGPRNIRPSDVPADWTREQVEDYYKKIACKKGANSAHAKSILSYLRKHFRYGSGYAGIGIGVLLSAPELAQAGQEGGLGGVANQGSTMLGEAVEGTVTSTLVGGGIIGGTAVTGGTFTVGGTTVVGGGTVMTGGLATAGTATGVGGLAIAAGAGGYALGNGIGGINVGGQSIHQWLGDGMYNAAAGVYNAGSSVYNFFGRSK